MVGLGQVLTHRNLGSIDNLLSLFIIKNNGRNLFFHFVSGILPRLEQVNELGEDLVVIDDFGQLGEVPREPFFEPHAEGVYVLVQLLDQSNCLNNGFVLPVYVGGALLAREGVAQTKLGSSHILVVDFLHDLDKVRLDSSHKLGDGLIERSGDAGFSEEPIRLV